MNSNKKYVLTFLFIILLFTAPNILQAAPPDPDCDPLNPACPIDGGVSFLIAAGIGIGIRKTMKK